MARAKKHLRFGQWVGLEDGVVVFGPTDKAGIEAWASSDPSPAPSTLDADRAYQERLAADLRAPRSEEMEEIKAVLLKRREPREVEIMARAIWPIVKAGRRIRLRTGGGNVMLPAKPQPQATASAA